MTTVDFFFNSENNEKIMLIDGVPRKLEKCWGNGNKGINIWGNTFFPSLFNTCNDTELEINVCCNKKDYAILEKLLEDYKNSNKDVTIVINEVKEKNIKEKIKLLAPVETKDKESLNNTTKNEEITQEDSKQTENNKESIHQEPKKIIKKTINYKIDLIIVHDKFTTDIAQQLNAIMSTIPECESCVLSENNWNGIKTQISSEEYVLFIGNVKDGLALQPLIQWKFEKLNMKYGWFGKKALMLVEKHIFKKEEIEELKNIFEEQKLNNVGVGANIGIFAGAAFLLGLIGIGISTVTMTIINKKNADKIYKCEYGYMINLLCNTQRVDFDNFIGYDKAKLLGEK